MSNIETLLAQKANLERQIEDERKKERDTAIARVVQLMVDFALNPDDISRAMGKSSASGGRSSAAATKRFVPPKYRDPATGQTWSGRGLQPRWLRELLANGASIDTFVISAS